MRSQPSKGEALSKEIRELQVLGKVLEDLQNMNLKSLRARYEELFGQQPRSKNLPFLRKQIAFRLQERMEGGLSPEARERLEEITPDQLPELKRRKVEGPSDHSAHRDLRLPRAGTVLLRPYRGVEYKVEIRAQDFRYRDRTYTSLSTIAKEITGTSWNGFTFFGLGKEKARG